MEFILIIIVVVIVSAISAATKKKPQSSHDQDAPPAAMSDIQRAFTMAANAPEKRPAPYPPPTPPQTAPYPTPTPVNAGVVHVQPQAQMTFGPVAPTVTESYTGFRDENLAKPMAAASVTPFPDIRSDVYLTDKEKTAASASPIPVPKTAPIPLFEDQQDIIKAFIYAEILPRRTYPPRLR